MSTIKLSCSAVVGVNPSGILKPGADGYYSVILGAFDFPNSAGAIYDGSKDVLAMFERSSSMMRRVRNKQMRGEVGHPYRTPGMTFPQFVNRVLTIREDNICHHIKDLEIDRNTVKTEDGRRVVAVRGKVKPAGVHREVVAESLRNPDEDTAFSVRTLTKDTTRNGVLHKEIKTLVTYDYVNEPGIKVATKMNTPSMESIGDSFAITPEDFTEAEREALQTGIGCENSGLDHTLVRSELGWFKTQNLASLAW